MSREQGKSAFVSVPHWDGNKWKNIPLISSSIGAPDAGSVPRLDLGGLLDFSFLSVTDVSTGIPDGGKLTKLNLLGKLDQSLINNVQASTGVPDAGKFVRLDAVGKLGLSLTNNTISSAGAADSGKFLRLFTDGSVRVLGGQSKFNVKGYPDIPALFVNGVVPYVWNPKVDGGWLHVFYSNAAGDDLQLTLNSDYIADNDFRGDELVVTVQQKSPGVGTGTISVWPTKFRFSSAGDRVPTVGNGAMTKYDIFNTVNTDNMLVTKTSYP